MILNKETIAAYKELLTHPKENRLTFDSIEDCFLKVETVTAKHVLAKYYMLYLNRDIPKVIIYIIMDEVFGQCDGKDEGGNLGYHLRFIK